ncbi:DUF7667 family protein [Paenibacillus lycopersici]|uniref:DUF7667 family protein n=1 Tax=Paenibacillus lycopersici TaxID=2704462 RepID=UPI00177E4456|nr:hypothetical protein [Paenibacillus lycopersici]
MIGIHPVHRRLAELLEKSTRLGGLIYLSGAEQAEISHCLHINAKLVRELDQLKQLAWIACEAGDVEWQYELCERIDKLEATL